VDLSLGSAVTTRMVSVPAPQPGVPAIDGDLFSGTQDYTS